VKVTLPALLGVPLTVTVSALALVDTAAEVNPVVPLMKLVTVKVV
jgi:hypothetical protein